MHSHEDARLLIGCSLADYGAQAKNLAKFASGRVNDSAQTPTRHAVISRTYPTGMPGRPLSSPSPSIIPIGQCLFSPLCPARYLAHQHVTTWSLMCRLLSAHPHRYAIMETGCLVSLPFACPCPALSCESANAQTARLRFSFLSPHWYPYR